ncbi:uncharacterized protein F4822DRAFT_289287 [Hypoxylon trugodes]|uniref:uncharacterized protein n=1 Tax=Hypoxylon trugodes TaxID=326681 RepID=UPI00219D36D8|nr:uncharacterized protein F4822DRAFT_289287 [Hypoxylon trugodes]KAI1387640.1 hypothetical protein F4822DRAFT_289287 [Hypoxylon trugodes]
MTLGIASVAYPTGGKFDVDYYINKHMPFVQAKLSPHGLKAWRVAQYTDPNAPYVIQAWLEFENDKQWEVAAASSEAKEVFGDVPNFTDIKPVLLVGSIVGSQSW